MGRRGDELRTLEQCSPPRRDSLPQREDREEGIALFSNSSQNREINL